MGDYRGFFIYAHVNEERIRSWVYRDFNAGEPFISLLILCLWEIRERMDGIGVRGRGHTSLCSSCLVVVRYANKAA